MTLVSSCIAQRGYSVWNKIKQFNDAVGCGYFFDADNGLIGSGQFGQVWNNFIGTQPLAIYWTSDGGKNWTQAIIPPGGRGRVTSISMQDRFTGFAAIYSQTYSVWKTTNGGKLWQDFSQGNNALSTCIFATKKALIKTSWFGNLGGSSVDGGASYSQIFDGGYNGSDGIDFADDNNGIVTLGPPGRASWISNDGGITWHAGGDLPESWSVYAVKGTKTFLTMSEDNVTNPGQTVYWSQNNGQNWTSRKVFQGSPSFTGHIGGAGNTLYVQTDKNTNQGLFRSDDLGASWVNVGGPSNTRDSRFAVTGCRGEVVYAFDNQGGVWKTTDGGDGAFGFSPRIGTILSAKVGDSVLIPIYIDSTTAPFSIGELSGNIELNTDLLTPVGFDTAGTLSSRLVNFDTLYTTANGSVNFLVKYTNPLKNGVALSKPIIFIKASVYLTKQDTTSVTLNSLNMNSGALQRSLIVCSSSSNLFTLIKQCGDTSLEEFMRSGTGPKLFSVSPNPSGLSAVYMHIALASEGDLTLDIADANGKFVIPGLPYGHYLQGNHKLTVNTAGLSNGVYYLRLHLDSGSYLYGRVVISK